MTPRSALRLQIEGHVQGVGFRWWTVSAARRLGLAGWVRNRRDGSVEVLVVGEVEILAGFERLCWQGPSAARVTSVRRSPADDDGSEGFEERATV
ncbi:MAG: acylphosphatase [Alphaproteobacteria bacterium]|nr:acylphosphatase [Alphaproteobacteria bacterium]